MAVTDVLEKRGRGVITIDGGATVSAAVGAMRREGLTALAVSRDGLRIEGIITEHEIVRGLQQIGLEGLMDMPVRSVMSRKVATCDPQESLRRVMSRMVAQRARHIAVVNAHGICGVLSMAEIVDHRLLEAEREVEEALDVRLLAS